MKIGACVSSVPLWKTVAEIGYDYVEANFSKIAAMSDDEFEEAKALLSEIGIRAEVCNGFFPGGFLLYAYDPVTQTATKQFEEIKETVYRYTHHGFARAKQLGTTVVVIGSGGPRRIPEDLSAELALQQLGEIFSVCADVAADYGITVTVEPLNKKECNVITTLSESLDLIDRVAHPNLLAMDDFYHSHAEEEPLATLDRAGDRLRHVHLCRPDRYSCTLADYDELSPYVWYLKALGYDARISFEGKNQNNDAPQALRDTYELFKHFRNIEA